MAAEIADKVTIIIIIHHVWVNGGHTNLTFVFKMDGIMHNLSNPIFDVLTNQALKVLTFLANQTAEIKALKAKYGMYIGCTSLYIEII